MKINNLIGKMKKVSSGTYTANGEEFLRLMLEITKATRPILIGILKNEIKSVSTYRLQKMGIDKKQYNRIRENPEQMSMETMVKYLEKIRAQKN
jgi:hypothetical protein